MLSKSEYTNPVFKITKILRKYGKTHGASYVINTSKPWPAVLGGSQILLAHS